MTYDNFVETIKRSNSGIASVERAATAELSAFRCEFPAKFKDYYGKMQRTFENQQGGKS